MNFGLGKKMLRRSWAHWVDLFYGNQKSTSSLANQNTKWRLLLGVAIACALCWKAEAQPAAKTHLIGFLSGVTLAASKGRLDAFRQGLRALGYVEGKSINIEWRFADGKQDLVPRLAEELVHLKVEVIVVAGGEPVVQVVKRITQTIPIVMTNAFDPVASGVVSSLARPGGNVTGVTSLTGTEIFGKQTEIIKETIPKLSRLGVLVNPDNSFSELALREIETVAKSFGVAVFRAEARNPDELMAAVALFTKTRVDAFIQVQDPMFIAERIRLIDLATKGRLPAMHSSPEYVDDGALMSYGTNRNDLFRRSATYVDKILKGAKPADIPVEQPKKFEFIINLKAAKQIGLTIPPNVLARADRVIR
jgi:putative tryptophan/tyrosine transport system substrate-binding protein